MKRLLQLGLIVAAAMMSSADALADSTALEVAVFPGGFNWPLWVAEDKGFFAAQGVSVHITPTPSSVQQMTNLIDGKCDVAMTAMDNLVAYRDGQGEVPKAGTDLIAVMGGDRGFLSLVAEPQVNAINQLRGKNVSVDAGSTGYVFVLFELLARAGLREPDYSIDRVGGVMQRFDALMEGKQAATLLVSPFELQAKAKGFHVLANAADSLGAYQGVVAGVRQGWANANRDRVEAFIRGYVQSVNWLYDPANRQEALEIFAKHMRNGNLAMAEAAYPILLNARTGFQPEAALDESGLGEVLTLRSKWATPQRKMQAVSTYYDSSFYKDALGK